MPRIPLIAKLITRLPVFLLTSFLLLPLAHAANWVKVGNNAGNSNQASIEVDSSSISKRGEEKVRIWSREIYATPKIPDSGAFSFSRRTLLSEFSCDKKTAALIQHIYANASGVELKNESFEGLEAKPILPDSNLESVFNYACKHRSPPKAAPVVAAPAPPEPVVSPVENNDSAKKTKKGKKAAEESAPVHPHWSYSGDTAPDKWGSLSAEYAACSQGQRQSPIDIRRTVHADLPPIQFAYKPIPLAIVDNGHSIKVDTPAAGGITLDGESYELMQFHFHKPSEEKLNGKTYDMVVHLVHKSKEGKLAVVAVMLEAGKEQPLIRTLWSNLPLEQDKPVLRDDIKIDPAQLIPAKRGYYTFMGSLTTPPCTEGVLWLVLKTPLQVSKEQLSGFATIYKNNVRPVQAVNGRVIKGSF